MPWAFWHPPASVPSAGVKQQTVVWKPDSSTSAIRAPTRVVAALGPAGSQSAGADAQEQTRESPQSLEPTEAARCKGFRNPSGEARV